VQHCLEKIVRYSNYRCIHEENGLFQATTNFKAHRPDITILHPEDLAEKITSEKDAAKLLIDVTITNPFTVTIAPGFQPTLKDASVTGIANNAPYYRKHNHYSAILKEHREAAPGTMEKLVALPFVMQTTGYIHKNSLHLLKDLAHKASVLRSKIPERDMLYRFKKLIACALQRGISLALLARSDLPDSSTISMLQYRAANR
jgi:hypothetical protein